MVRCLVLEMCYVNEQEHPGKNIAIKGLVEVKRATEPRWDKIKTGREKGSK